MAAISNIYLFSVGIAIASVGTLGFVVYFNNKKSITNKTFLVFSLISIVWNICNYLIEQPLPSAWAIWALRGIVFFAVWYCFYIFQLLYVFPKADFSFPKNYKIFLVPLIAILSIITLTPLVFQRISSYTPAGGIGTVDNGPGIFIFGIAVVCLIVTALWTLIRKTARASTEERKPLIFVLIGTFLTFALYIAFNFISPAFLNNSKFIQLSAVFTFPFVAFTAYAIIKHHLLNVKVFAAQALTFILAVTTFAEVFVAKDIASILFQSAVFILVLCFGILLIQSVQREVEQREELARLNIQIEAQNAQLQDLSHFKSELLSLASHQIKSPLAVIKGLTTLMKDGNYGPVTDKTKETMGKVIQSANGLVSLIDTLLDVRKVEEGKMEYKFEKTDLNKMVADMVDALHPLAEEKKLEFKFDSPGKEVFVSADPEKLKQVIQNLTDNAIKYTPTGFVHVELKEDGNTVTISVSDSGLGISPILIPHLFEEFVRDDRVKQQIRGTGLGLYVARKIAEAHGGKIWAESPGESKGSTFHLALPEMK